MNNPMCSKNLEKMGKISQNQQRIKKLFLDLQENGCSEKNRILEFTSNGRPFESDIFHKKILCNNCLTFPEDDHCVRWGLLHEEGHLKFFHYRSLVILIVAVEILFMSYLAFCSNMVHPLIGIFLFILGFFVVFFITYRCCYPLLKEDEVKSDVFGADCIYEKYHEHTPSKIVEKALNFNYFQQEEVKISGLKTTIIEGIRNFFDGYYPSYDERVSYTRKKSI